MGHIVPGLYAAEDSICLKQPLGYTAIADDNDTFILSISRKDLLSIFPEEVKEQMTQYCLDKLHHWQGRAAEISNLKICDDFESNERKLTLKKHIKMNFPKVTRNAQRKLTEQSMLGQCSGNERVFLGNKIFQHNYERVKARKFFKDITVPHDYQASGVQYKHDTNERRKLDKIGDKDVMRLQKIKEELYPKYDYQKLIELSSKHRIGPGVLDFHEQSTYDDLKLKIRRARMESQRQENLMQTKEMMCGLLALPSVQSYIKRIEEMKSKMDRSKLGVIDDR